MAMAAVDDAPVAAEIADVVWTVYLVIYPDHEMKGSQ